MDTFFGWFNRVFDRFISGYARGVRGSIRYSWLIIVALLGICAGAYFLFRAKPSGFVPPEDGGRLYVTFQLADASSTTESVAVMEKIMKVVSSTPGYPALYSRLGLQYPEWRSDFECRILLCHAYALGRSGRHLRPNGPG